jgi:hypothetical protein
MSTKFLFQREANHIRMPSLIMALGLAAIYACSTYEPAPIESDVDFLPAPTKVVVKVGNGMIDLTWFFEDTSLVKEYRVYRRNQNESAFRRIASTSLQACHDDLLANGTRYEYQIAAVSKANVEGEHSKTVSAVPAIYSILLSGGAKYTNRRNIPITITAPQNTTLMMLSNDSSFSDGQWQPFATSDGQWQPFATLRQWDLTFGDGVKKVYAKFRNVDDQELAQPVQAEIILDTIATIKFIEEDSQGRNLSVPDKLHIRLGVGEIKGTATADIFDTAQSTTGQEFNIRLYDDGTNGDQTPDDGIYETDYFVRRGLEVINAYVFGYFTDAAGNGAPKATAPGRVTIESPPTFVTLQEPTTIIGSSASLSLRWTPNTDRDFVSYQLCRSRTYIVSLSSPLVTSFNDQSVTSYIDTGLEPDTEYFYRIYVFDTAGNNSGSNTVQGRTPVNEPPKPVVLSQPIPDTTALKLSWSPSTENDFANYRLYRSTTSPVDTSFAPIAIINNQTQTEFRDFSAVPNLLYYYRLFVFDRFGLTAGSNEVQGRLPR